jgi:hypothetical protein
MTKYRVTGDPTEVAKLLRDALTPEELASLKIEASPSSSPFAVQPRRGEPISTTVLVWISGAVATGMAYDVVKALSIKVWQLLEARYGAEKIKKEEPGD